MGAIGGLLGTAGGVSGTGIGGPSEANIQQGVTPEQVNQSYAGGQQGLAAQKALLESLQGQRGLQAQSGVLTQQQGLEGQLSDAGGVANQSQAFNQQHDLAINQNALAQQYQNIANGTGPNPAQAMLNQATGQNVANQAALMAGQRGAGANVGLMARQAAQQGAATQQQAVGQGATMQANQQIAGLHGLSGQQQAIGATNQSMAGIAANQIAQQQAQQQALANQANTLAGQQIGATTGYSQGQQANQQGVLNSLAAQNQAKVASTGNVNSANAGMANTTMQGQQGMIGGLMNSAGSAAMFAAGGGEITKQNFADGGPAVVAPAAPVPMAPSPPPGPASSFGRFLQGWSSGMSPQGDDGSQMNQMGDQSSGGKALNKGATSLGSGLMKLAGKSGKPPGQSMAGPDGPSAAIGAMAAKGGLAQGGGSVKAKAPGQKAVKSGNSYDNDKIPAMLSEGEVVIPRSVMQSKDPARSAADFVAKVIAKRGAR